MDRWQGRLAGLDDALAAWTYRWIEAHPTIAEQLEQVLHAHGVHGPWARHLLRTRVVPVAVLLSALLALLAGFVVFRLWRRTMARRRSRRPAGPAVTRQTATP